MGFLYIETGHKGMSYTVERLVRDLLWQTVNLSQGRESINLAGRDLKDLLGKWEIHGEGSAELGG